MSRHVIVGGYGERGLHPLTLEADGSLTAGPPSDAAANASYGAYSARHNLLYLVNEREDGVVGAYRRSAGEWGKVAEAPSHGALPCFLSLSPDQGNLAVANYGDGACAVIALDRANGLPAGRGSVRRNQGCGPVEDRQDGPHAHCAVFSAGGRRLYQVDLGTDEIRAFSFDAERGALSEGVTTWRAPPGSGPRHLVLHPSESVAFLISELASTLTVLRVDESGLEKLCTVSTLPAGHRGESLGGHVAFDAITSRLYATNRGHDSIASFAYHEGGLRLLGHSPSGGASPRFFLLIDRTMLVANEEGGLVTAFRIQDYGTLVRCGEAAVPKPAYIVEVPHN